MQGVGPQEGREHRGRCPRRQRQVRAGAGRGGLLPRPRLTPGPYTPDLARSGSAEATKKELTARSRARGAVRQGSTQEIPWATTPAGSPSADRKIFPHFGDEETETQSS
nr:uncharacterized protein KIAA0040 homolog isoform X1 [Chlorocebus sabaeus]